MANVVICIYNKYCTNNIHIESRAGAFQNHPSKRLGPDPRPKSVIGKDILLTMHYFLTTVKFSDISWALNFRKLTLKGLLLSIPNVMLHNVTLVVLRVHSR